MAERRLGLALGSGSARGLAHIGVLKVLEREGIAVSMVAGTSIGALVGGAYAAGMTPAKMEEFACSIGARGLLALADPGRPTAGLVNGRRVQKLIERFVDHTTFDATRVPFACIAVDVAAQQRLVLRQGDLSTAIRASISTPGIFAPVAVDGRLLVDGAVMDPIPVDVARELGADVVVAVSNSGPPNVDVPVFTNCEIVRLQRRGSGPDAGLLESVYSYAVPFVVDTLKSPTVLQLLTGSVVLMERELSDARLKGADLVIAPTIQGAEYLSFYQAEGIIAAGEAAAEAAVPAIRAALLSDAREPARGARRGAPAGEGREPASTAT